MAPSRSIAVVLVVTLTSFTFACASGPESAPAATGTPPLAPPRAVPTAAEPNRTVLADLRRQLNTTDLAVGMRAEPDPAQPGMLVVYHVTVRNNGPNPASDVRVIDTLPSGVSYVGATEACTQSVPLSVVCDLGEIEAQGSRTFSISVRVAFGPEKLVSRVVAENRAGPDDIPDNNVASTETTLQWASNDRQ